MSGAQLIPPKLLETTTFKLIVARHRNSEVLLVRNGQHFILPNVNIPKWTRVAPEITNSVLQTYGLRTVALFHPEAQSAKENGDRYAVLEPKDSSWQPSADLTWVLRNELRNHLCSAEAEILEGALADADAYNDGALHGPFARAGWLDDLVSWAQKLLDPYGLTITGGFRQLNCGTSFSLLRLETTGPAVWFKAVGEPNLREFPITMALAEHFPSYVPTLIATQPSWHGWLTFEAEGSILDDTCDLATWKNATRTLAALQIESVTKTSALLDAGCRRVGVAALVSQIDPFFDVMAQLMARQTKIPPHVLNSEELRALARQLKQACACLAESELPETLGHMDFNPGNIIASPSGCVFLDWAEAYVGHPFFTFEYLREHLGRNHPGQETWKSEVTSCYLKPWASLNSSEQASRAIEITPLLAVLAYALSNNAWRDQETLQDSGLAAYFRSLTRRMQREVRLLKERRAQCLN